MTLLFHITRFFNIGYIQRATLITHHLLIVRFLGKKCYYSETTSVECTNVCIIQRKFNMDGLKANEKMDPEGHFPDNTNSHYIILNSM